jgi:Fic-DOC domain mobile mystery protein B
MAPDVTIHDRSGLLLSQSPAPTDNEINQHELINIAEAIDWIDRSRLDVGKVEFWQRLHREMFGQVWEWAGVWRKHDPNIGVPAHEIQPELKKLQDDLAVWLEGSNRMSNLEIIARFHHRLVQIHPFSNGNGRWGRLVVDALARRRLELGTITWATGDDELRDSESKGRQQYIAAIKAADRGDIEILKSYLDDLNPALK